MKRCVICKKLIWFWQSKAYTIQVLDWAKKEYIKYNYRHVYCAEHYLTPEEQELMR
ncbi:MAG: hypothetical protein K0S93_161 [Nitrososphaeraceae archaeon]|jgi:hypothetical protein|nr:hypothetical protein [Nitrososphaeraceae archaeon]